MAEALEEKTHCWEGLSEYRLDFDEVINYLEGDINDVINILKKMKPNQYFPITISYLVGDDVRNPNKVQNYLNKLKESGLNVGKGDCEYGFKMPLPTEEVISRDLIIFRRR